MKHLLYNAAEVRYELYGVWGEIHERQNEHLFTWHQKPGIHPAPCRVCDMYRDQKNGVNHAIRHFGGRPRR